MEEGHFVVVKMDVDEGVLFFFPRDVCGVKQFFNKVIGIIEEIGKYWRRCFLTEGIDGVDGKVSGGGVGGIWKRRISRL